jgi:predicted transcriptional regulator
MPLRGKKKHYEQDLSRRERQIMGVVLRLKQASVADILRHIPDPPTASAVRRLCHILEEKGHLRGKSDGIRNIYTATFNSKQAGRSALENIMEIFFGGSPHMLVASLLEVKRKELSKADIKRLQQMIDSRRREKDPS